MLLPIVIVGGGIALNPGAALVGFNPIWVFLLGAAPIAALVLHGASRSQRRQPDARWLWYLRWRWHDVFIAYAHADSALMNQLRGDLRARGLDVIVDQDLPLGEQWSTGISRAVAHSHVNVVWSRRRPASRMK